MIQKAIDSYSFLVGLNELLMSMLIITIATKEPFQLFWSQLERTLILSFSMSSHGFVSCQVSNLRCCFSSYFEHSLHDFLPILSPQYCYSRYFQHFSSAYH
jgi:hypothetical protein